MPACPGQADSLRVRQPDQRAALEILRQEADEPLSEVHRAALLRGEAEVRSSRRVAPSLSIPRSTPALPDVHCRSSSCRAATSRGGKERGSKGQLALPYLSGSGTATPSTSQAITEESLSETRRTTRSSMWTANGMRLRQGRNHSHERPASQSSAMTTERT